MTAVRIAVVGGLVVLGGLCWLAAAGVAAVTEILITMAALVVMIGGGNWLSGQMSPYRTAARPAAGTDAPPAEPVVGTPPPAPAPAPPPHAASSADAPPADAPPADAPPADAPPAGAPDRAR